LIFNSEKRKAGFGEKSTKNPKPFVKRKKERRNKERK
jgi:hypothetical protein